MTLPADRFLDREQSWLDFNARVLELAEDADVPLLERVRFLGIFARNLDEFFMVRVAGLTRRIATGLAVTGASGLAPREQLEQISARTHGLLERQARLFADDLVPALAKEGIEILRWDELAAEERERLNTLFASRILPVLTPLAVDPAHPFPYISGLSLNLAVVVRDPGSGAEHFARVKVPPLLARFVPTGRERFVPLEDVISAHLHQLFTGMDVIRADCFRVTRNADLEVEEDLEENLLQALERELLRRRFGPPVRLEVEDTMDPYVLDLLARELEVGPEEVFRVPGPLALAGLAALADLDRDELKFPAFIPTTHIRLAEVDAGKPGDYFAALRAGDVLVHHPYDSFATSVQALVEAAAVDPKVLAIKQTLYRTSGDSPVVDALIDAAEAGKQVLVLVELQARFDEQANIRWARALEQAGCHVVYGQVGLKTHCQLCLVVRQDSDGLRRYAHVGTGDYNPRTARRYEDLGLLTADAMVGGDLTDLFNRLSGYSLHRDYRRLLVAPNDLRSGLLARIARVVAAHQAGQATHIQFKLNNLVDEAVIDALYGAAQVGVPIDLLVRAICALRPGVPGLSETVRVRSVVGRFLEHSRVYRFRYGPDPEEDEVLIGSADVMHRNLDRRVEVLVRVVDPAAVAELDDILAVAMGTDVASWHLDADGQWTRMPGRDYQELMLSRKKGREAL